MKPNSSQISKKSEKFDYFLVFLLIFFSTRSNVWVLGMFTNLIPILLCLIIYYNRKIKFSETTFFIFLVPVLFFLAYLVKYNGVFNPAFSYRVFTLVLFPYLVLSIVRRNFFEIYENLVYKLSVISLVLFSIQLIIPNILYSILSKIEYLIFRTDLNPSFEYANIIVYTINRPDDPRNCGFAWEPGGFATFLILAIVINLAKNNFELKNKKLLVLIISLFSTLSTTGLVAFLLVSVWVIFNKAAKWRFLSTIAFTLIGIFIINLPFMGDKIISYSRDPSQRLNSFIEQSRYNQQGVSLGRFAGLVVNYEDFLRNPIIGYGGNDKETLSASLNVDITSMNGLGSWLSMYGIVGMFIFIYTYLLSFNNLAKIYNFKKPQILLLVILSIGFGFGIIQTYLFFGFQLSFILNNNNQKSNQII